MALIPVRDARQSYPPFDAIFSPFKHGSIRYGRTASAADRAVLVELRRFLAVNHATGNLPSGPRLIGTRVCGPYRLGGRRRGTGLAPLVRVMDHRLGPPLPQRQPTQFLALRRCQAITRTSSARSPCGGYSTRSRSRRPANGYTGRVMGCIGLTLFIPSLRMTEALSVAKYPGYRDYQATTSALIPLPRLDGRR